MPAFERKQRAVIIQAEKDFHIVCDYGIVHGHAGDYVILDDFSLLHSMKAAEMSKAWQPTTPEEGDEAIEYAIRTAIERGRW